jgi:hypothetical protein
MVTKRPSNPDDVFLALMLAEPDVRGNLASECYRSGAAQARSY